MSDSHPPTERDDPRLRQILDAAADLPPEQRQAFLDEACGGDARLRAEVEFLLISLMQAPEFLANPTAGRGDETVPEQAAHEATGSHIGPYKLLQKIGEGGMGTVYMAEQERPVVRRVAIKIIKLGMDTRQVIARFEAERQALAMMDHANIARVLDAGATDEGRPYFVMELVKGVSITDYCDQNNLPTRQRLELFVPVCRAVQHAHTKGIIHRDIKPSNVLVTMHDGVPVPKVIDFGVAKATGGRLTDKTLFTEYQQFVGTPEYMSPEQAEMSGLDIDTRADVYALGVLLYELLTGSTPFDAKTLRRAAYAEIQRIIREVEPPKPSTRVSTLGDTLTSVAAHRSIDPRKLGALMRGDLDWIVMKCLEKDRTRRYETANAVAADVQRYLKDEPVEASPPSATYKLRKFARKHKKEAAALVAVAAALLLGIIGTSAGMIRAGVLLRRTQSAEKLATEQKNDANKAKDQAKEAQTRAERQANRANAVSDFMASMLKSARPNAYRRAGDIRVIDVLEGAADSIDRKLKDQPEAEAQVRSTLGTTYLTLGMWDEALKQLKLASDVACAAQGEESEQALRIAPELIVVTAMRYPQEAGVLARRCYEIARRKLGEDHEVTRGLEADIAISLGLEHRFTQAAELYRKLIERAKRRGKGMADDPGLYHSYGRALLNDGKVEEAEAILRQVVELIQAQPDKVEVVDAGQSLLTYGQILVARGKLDEAKTVFETAIARQQDRLSPLHPDAQNTVTEYADLLETMGRYGEALEKHRELLEIGRKLGREEDPGYAWRQVKTATLLLKLGKQEEATRAMNQVIAQVRARTGEFSQNWLDAWSNALLVGGMGSPEQWKSQSLHANLWCALDELLLESPGVADLAVDGVDWDKLHFRLERWNASADATPSTLVSVAEGTLRNLMDLAEPGPGIYRLSLDVARPNSEEPQAREAWLLFTAWDVNVYTSGGDERTPEAYHTLLGNKPAEQRRLNNLAIPHGEPNSKPGPGGRTEYFALSASSSVDLPAGRYRVSATSDDGVRLYIDGRLVIDSWVPRNADRDDAVLELPAGRHPLRVEFFQQGLQSQLWIQLAPAGGALVTELPVVGGDHRGSQIARRDPTRIEAALIAEIQRKPYSPQALISRARFLAGQGRFTESAKDFGDALKIDPSDYFIWADSAEVTLQAGDVDGYRRQCTEMLSRFGASTDRATCSQIVKDCAIMPDAVPDFDVVMEMGDRAVAGEHAGPNALCWRALAKGMAEYRAGHFASAVDWLRKAIAPDSDRREDTCQFFIAMAESRLGRAAEAEAAFARGTELLDKNGPKAGEFWTVKEWIVAVHARNEAALLLGHLPDSPATRPIESGSRDGGTTSREAAGTTAP